MAKKVEKQVFVKKQPTGTFFSRHMYPILIAGFALVLFGNSLFNDYNMDDELVTRNHRLTSKGMSAIPEIFTSPYYQDDMGYAYEYRPIPLTTFAIEHTLFGEKAGAGHFVNWVLYALLSVCVLRFLVSIGGVFTPVVGFIITLLFCAHSSHTEVVSSIKNRDEILGMLFGILSAHMALAGVRKTNWWQVGASALLFLLAMLCKSTFVTFAFFIPLGLILFSECTLLYILLVTGPLALASYFVLDIHPAHYKLWLALLLPVGVTIIFYLVRGGDFRAAWASIKDHKPVNISGHEPFSGLNYWLQGFNKSSLYSLAIVVVLLLVYFLIFKDALSVSLFVVFILAGSLFLQYKNKEFWSFSIGALVAAVILAVEFVNHTVLSGANVYAEVFYILLIYLIFWGKPAFRIFPILLIAIIQYYLATTGMLGDIFYVFLFMLFTRLVIGRKMLWLSFIVVICFLTASVIDVIQSFPNNSVEFPIVIQLCLLLLMLNYKNTWAILVSKTDRTSTTSIAVIFLVSAGLYYVNLSGQLNNAVRTTIYNDKDYLNVVKTVVEKPMDRPLQFAEFPLPPGSSANLKVGTACLVLGHYLTKTFFPYPLSFYYGYAYIKPATITYTWAIVWLIFHVLLLLFAIYSLRQNRYLAFGIIVYLLSVVIYCGYFIPVPGIVADRYLLVPTLGYSIVLVLALFALFKVSNKTIKVNQLPQPLKGILLAVLSIYTGLTFARNFDWKNDLTLMRKDIQYVHMSSQANNLLALHLMQNAEQEQNPVLQTELRKEALTHFKKALEIYPTFFNVAFDIGRTYSALNMPDSAVLYFIKATRIDSTYLTTYQYAAEILINRKSYDEAIPLTQYYIRKAPKDYDGYSKLSYIYFNKAQYALSIQINKQALENVPDGLNPLINIAQTFRAMNQPDSCLYYFRRAQLISPDNPLVKQAIQQLAGTKP